MRAFLLIGGAAIEFVGILFVASPDFFPLFARWARRLGAFAEPVTRRVRRLLGIRRNVGAEVSLGAYVVGGARAAFERGIAEDATLEQKVDFLVSRDKEAQRDVQALGDRLGEFEKAIEPKLDEVREGMAGHVATSLDAAHRAYLPLRQIGVAFVVVGLAMATTGHSVD